MQNKKTRRFLTIDTKGTDAKFDGTDYIGLTLNYVDIDNNWHFMSYRMKLSTAELVDLMYNWWNTHGLEVIGYERTAFTEGMKAYLDSEARRRNKFLPLVRAIAPTDQQADTHSAIARTALQPQGDLPPHGWRREPVR